MERSIPYDTCVAVEVLGVDRNNRGVRTTFLLPFDRVDSLPAVTRPRRLTVRGWRRVVRRILAAATPTPASIRCALSARFDPMPYQLEPVLAYVRGAASRFLIADAVGLGKTVQAGLIVAEMLERRRDGRALIVVPSGLREQWRVELLDRFAITADVLDALALARMSAALPSGVNPWSAPRVIVTSIDFAKRPEVMRSLEPLLWDLIVFDEAHSMAGRSDRQVAASGLATRGRTVVLLTATPHSGDHDAFVRLCGLGDLESRFPLMVYRRTRAELGNTYPRRSRWWHLSVSSAEQTLHGALVGYARRVWAESSVPGARLAMVVLLKRGASSPAALLRSLARRRELLGEAAPATQELQPLLPFGSEADDEPCAELGAPGLSDRRSEILALDALIAQAQDAAREPRKISFLRRLLQRSRESVIVFTQYRDTLDELATVLADRSVARIHGGLSGRQRREAVEAFTGGATEVLLATDAASEGLNLQARCRLVINFDIPWTPLRIEQRVGRVDRIGQARRVHAWQMVAAGTYEDLVSARVQARTARAHVALDALESVEEHETTRAILGATTDERADRPRLATTRVRPDAVAAAAEAHRILTARALAGRASSIADARPVVAVRRGKPRRVLLGYGVRYADAFGFHAWDMVVGVLGPDTPVEHDPDLVALLTSGTTRQRILETLGPRVRGDLRAWRLMAATVLRRDRAMSRALRRDRARLSSALVQPELFSHRATRSLAPQLYVLDESISRLREASAEMRAVGHVSLESITPLFAGMLPKPWQT